MFAAEVRRKPSEDTGDFNGRKSENEDPAARKDEFIKCERGQSQDAEEMREVMSWCIFGGVTLFNEDKVRACKG